MPTRNGATPHEPNRGPILRTIHVVNNPMFNVLKVAHLASPPSVRQLPSRVGRLSIVACVNRNLHEARLQPAVSAFLVPNTLERLNERLYCFLSSYSGRPVAASSGTATRPPPACSGLCSPGNAVISGGSRASDSEVSSSLETRKRHEVSLQSIHARAIRSVSPCAFSGTGLSPVIASRAAHQWSGSSPSLLSCSIMSGSTLLPIAIIRR